MIRANICCSLVHMAFSPVGPSLFVEGGFMPYRIPT
jgi:hypothetical protein